MQSINAYLNFDGNAREAMTFYQQCLGGSLEVMTFAASGVPHPPGSGDRVVHARLQNGGAVLMASDVMPGMPFVQGNHAWLNIACESDAEVDALFAKLLEGGEAKMPPSDTFWNARFGMLTDRFGMNWMFNHERGARS